MKTLKNWTRSEMWQKNHYNPSQTILFSFKKKEYGIIIQAGSSDYVDVFCEEDSIYILFHNTSLGYVGLENFSLNENDVFEQFSDVFFQGYEVDEVFGENFLDLAPMTMCKRLQPYVDCV